MPHHSGTYGARRDPGSVAGAAAPRTASGRRRAHHPHPSAGSVGLRLHLRNQRLLPRCRARHPRRHVRARLPRGASRGFLQGHGARLRGVRRRHRHPPRFAFHRARAGTGGGAWPGPQHLRLHPGQRRLRLGHRARERALSHAVQGLRPLLRARPGDRHRRTRFPIRTTCR